MAINHLWVPECFFISAFILCTFLFWKFKPGFDSSDRMFLQLFLHFLEQLQKLLVQKALTILQFLLLKLGDYF